MSRQAREAQLDRRLLIEAGVTDEEIAALGPDELAELARCVKELAETGTSQTAEKLVEADYKWEPVSCEQFLEDPYYLGDQTADMFPLCRKALIDIFDGPVRPIECILGGAIGWGKCLSAHNLVPTSSGMMRIDDLVGRRNPTKVITHRGQIADIGQRHVIGHHPVIKIVTKWGYEIEGRADHRIIVIDNGALVWRRLEDVKISDVAVLQRGTRIAASSAQVSRDTAELLGVWVGDGHFVNTADDAQSNGLVVTIGEHEKDYLAHVVSLFVAVFGREPKVHLYAGGTGHKAWRVSEHSVERVRDWRMYGLTSGSSHKCIPSCVMEGTLESHRAFLRGLFDTDGTCGHGRIEFATVSERLAYEVQCLLLNLGVTCTRYFKPNKCKGAWVIRIVGRASRDCFTKMVGFKHARKAAALTELCEVTRKSRRSNDVDIVEGFGSTFEAMTKDPRWARQPNAQRTTAADLRYDFGDDAPAGLAEIIDRDLLTLPVKAIEHSTADCYDISVPGDESYVAAGFLSHNTTLAAAGITYDLYRVGCLRNPHAFYGLMPGANITFAMYSVSKEQAADSAFGKLVNWVESSPYFKEKMPKVGRHTTKAKFRGSPTMVIVGSQEVHAIGKDVYAFLLDEANFLTSKSGQEDQGRAYSIYTNAKNRLKSRFLDNQGDIPGKVWLISSKRTHASFLEGHVKSSKDDIETGRARLYEYNQWEVRDQNKFRKPKFRVELGDRIHPSKILEHGEDPRPGGEFITVPGEYRDNFEKDIDGAIRDIAGKATESMCPLIQDKTCLYDCIAKDAKGNAELFHPFTQQEISTSTSDDIAISTYFDPKVLFQVRMSQYVPRYNPESPRYVHVDVAFTEDSMGIACVHQSGMKIVKRSRADGTSYEDRVPEVTVDFMLRIKPPKGGEIDLAKMRAFLISLRDMGLPILRVTLDGHQCFTGDTRVRLLDGTNPTMVELARRYQGDREFWVYSYDNNTGRIVAGKARNARKTGKLEIVAVTLDNGQLIRCTKDHRFMLRNGDYCEARNLKNGDSLMPLYSRISERGRDSLTGYEMIQQPDDGFWNYTHRIVSATKKKPSKDHILIHHKDFVKSNNSPENLDWMIPADHTRLHQRHCIRYFSLPGWWTEERRAEQSRVIKALHKDPAFRANAVKNLRPGQRPCAEAILATAARTAARNRSYFNHPRRLKNISGEAVIDAAKNNPTLSQRELGALFGVSQDVIANRLKEVGIGCHRGWRARMARINHKVISVQDTGQVEDVYDIEVDQYHNFALSAGVIVHNSRDTMQILRKLDFDALLYSVDRTDEAYMTLRQAIMERRLRYYEYETLIREMTELERNIEEGKVDHPKISPSTGQRGSKDVSDGLAGSVFNCMSDLNAGGMGVSSADPHDNIDRKLKLPNGGELSWEQLEKDAK